jgi:hypothetical protein
VLHIRIMLRKVYLHYKSQNDGCDRVVHRCDCWKYTMQLPIVLILAQCLFNVILFLVFCIATVLSFQIPTQKRFHHLPPIFSWESKTSRPNNFRKENVQSQSTTLIYGNANNDFKNEEDDPMNDQPTNLNHFMKEQLTSHQPTNIFSGRTDDIPDYFNHKKQQRYDPLMGYTLEDLESFAASASLSSHPKIPKYDTNMFPDATDSDGIYLDPNEYIQSSQTDYVGIADTIPFADNLDEDIIPSKRTEVSTNPILPVKVDPRYQQVIQGYVETIISEPTTYSTSSYMDDMVSMPASGNINNDMNDRQPRQLPVDNPNFGYQRYDPNNSRRNNVRSSDDMNDMASLDELWSTITQIQAQQQQRQNDPTISEEIHRQIFENEAGFYNQSQIFLESLTNTTMAGKANVERRGRYYRTRQEQAIQSLNEQIEEFEALLFAQQHEQSAAKDEYGQCKQCHCRLSEEEINNPASKDNNKEPICRICYMERLVSSSKQNDIAQNQRDSSRTTATYTANHRTGVIPLNTRRYTTLKSFDNTVPAVQRFNDSVVVEDNNSTPLPETMISNLDQSMVFNERYDALTNSTVATAHNGNITDDNNYSSMLLEEETQHTDVSVEFENFSDNENLIYPWVEVMDPDTEEIFYWNEETEEMRWEL